MLAPGLRLGFLVAPKSLYPKLLQAKQAADLHSPSFNQRMVAEVMKDGFLDRHVPTIRALYKSQRDAMLARATARDARPGRAMEHPDGGMFLWARLPQGVNAIELLPKAVDKGVAFVPGAAFYAGTGGRAHAAPVVRHRQCRADQDRTSRPWPPRSANNLARGEAMLKIWGRISSINVRKVVLAAQWLEIPFERIDAGHEFGIVKTPDYLAKQSQRAGPIDRGRRFPAVGIERHRALPVCQAFAGQALSAGACRALRRRTLDGLAADHAQSGAAALPSSNWSARRPTSATRN